MSTSAGTKIGLTAAPPTGARVRSVASRSLRPAIHLFMGIALLTATSVGVAADFKAAVIGYTLASSGLLYRNEPCVAVVWNVTRAPRELRFVMGNLDAVPLLQAHEPQQNVAFVVARTFRGSLKCYTTCSVVKPMVFPVGVELVYADDAIFHEIPVGGHMHGPDPLRLGLELPLRWFHPQNATDLPFVRIEGTFHLETWTSVPAKCPETLDLAATFTISPNGQNISVAVPTEDNVIVLKPIDLGSD